MSGTGASKTTRSFGWLRLMVATLLIAAGGLAVFFELRRPAYQSPLTSDILVLGDSQLSFGAGPVLRDFFSDLKAQCANAVTEKSDLQLLSKRRFAMIGTRSTSLQSWVTHQGRAWELLCHKDKKWGVNASTWGTVKPPDKRYVQIGEGENFQFCRQPETPLQNLFATGYYRPRLLMIFVGGNGAGRLARRPRAAGQDVKRFVRDLPPGTGCLFMMTAPVLSAEDNAIRGRAQDNLRAAFAAEAKTCSFVDGHTPATRAAIEGQVQYFKRDDAGNVTDPHHANSAAAQKFLAARRGALCRAIVEQLRKSRKLPAKQSQSPTTRPGL